MNLKTLSRLLKELLLTNDRVSLPGMGSFIAELAPSVFSDRALVIHPPYRRILFRTSEIWNDGLLEQMYAKENELDIDEAREKIQEFLRNFKSELNSKKSIVIPDLGTMRATDQHDYFFVASKDLFIYPDAYGLEPINIKVLSKPGVIEHLSFKERSKEYNYLETNIKEKKRQERKKEKELAKETELEAKRKAREDELESRRLAKEEKVKAKEKEKEAFFDDLEEDLEIATGRKKTIAFFVTLFVLVAIVTLMVIFKDQIRPVWEWILYSKEERELLRLL